MAYAKPGPEVMKISRSTQLSMKFFLLINVKMPFRSRKDGILGFPEPERMLIFFIFSFLGAFKISCSAELSMKFL